jgi:hypothetical protein
MENMTATDVQRRVKEWLSKPADMPSCVDVQLQDYLDRCEKITHAMFLPKELQKSPKRAKPVF